MEKITFQQIFREHLLTEHKDKPDVALPATKKQEEREKKNSIVIKGKDKKAWSRDGNLDS